MMRCVTGVVLIVLFVAGCGARTGIRDGDGGHDGSPDAEVTPPSALCEPDVAWTTIDRRSVVYGDATDDGWITDWRWEILERPSGSVVELVPPESQISSLTPDREGDFLLRLTVTDNDNLESSCDVRVHSIVGPPVAFCPEDITGASVGRTYTLEGDGFDDEMIISFSWEVTSCPEGSRAVPLPDNEPVTNLTPDAAGIFELTFTITDNDGQSDSCTVSVSSSGPPTAICPEEVTVPTRQPHTVRGDGEDDGEIAQWFWEVVESPPGSRAAPEPPSAQNTTLTPDRVGRYVLRLTVTDDTGLTDSCEAVVNATPTPPDAICPDPISTTPLTEITIRGSGIDDGTIVGYEWSLLETPAGSSAAPPSPAFDQVTTFMPDVAGEYTLLFTVIDDYGMDDSCEATVIAIPGEGLRVEMYWNPPDNGCDNHDWPCDPSDVDLHLLHPEAPHWFNSTPGRSDCYYANCVGGFGWDTAAIEDDPRLDLDDVDGFGPENINIDEPVVGNEYTVGIHYYDDEATEEDVQVYVSIFCGTIDVDPVYEVGPVALTSFGWSDVNEFWRVATVVWDGFRCTVDPLVGADGGPDIIIARDAQETR